MTKVLEVFLTGVVELTACVSGILALYCTVIRFTSVQSFELYPIVKRADQVSFGIYIFHQFILVALYHYTPIVSSVNQWILPWIGFVVALPVSWLLTSLTLHTKIGRYLIG
jgi:peptidoglycan/LPS O-acetylase OafA/YrhL